MTGYIRDKLNIVTSFVNPSEQIHPPQRKVLVIQCHPRSDSFSKAISDNVIEGMQQGMMFGPNDCTAINQKRL